MRKGEIRALKWASVDREHGTVTVEPVDAKSGKARTIPLFGVAS
jgi:integrase